MGKFNTYVNTYGKPKNQKALKPVLILGLSFLIFISFSAIPMISAEIIEQESYPAEVIIYIQNNSVPTNELKIDVLSPIEKTYKTKNISLEFETNKNSACSYKLNDEMPVVLGRGNYFKDSIHVPNGDHVLKISCNSNGERKSVFINFEVDKDTNRENELIREEVEYEESLRETNYGEWTCINNRLQRTISYLGNEEIEYAGECGIVSDYSSNESKNKNIGEKIYNITNVLIILLIGINFILIFLTRR